MATRQAKYNEDSIEHLEGLDGVRAKPGMYLGERGAQMVFRSNKELIDNVLDEFMAGRGSEIEFYADSKSNTYIVADKAEGIPVGMHKQAKISTMTLIFTKLHAGGKLNAATSTYTGGSAGTHGVGAAAANAVCKTFEVWTYREGICYYQKFSCGKPVTKVEQKRIPADVLAILINKTKRGTVIRMVPDQTIVSVDKGKTPATLDMKAMTSWLKNLAALNANLKITVSSAGGKTQTFLNKTGIIKVLNDQVAALELEPMGKPVVLDDGALAFAVQWTSYPEDDGLTAFVSSSLTRDGGTHLDEFYEALAKSIMPLKGKRDKFTPKDLRNGLVGVINYRMSSPEFSSQVKDRLTSKLNKDVFNRAFAAFNAFFAKNKSLARKIIKRAADAKKAKEEFSKAMAGISKMNASKRGVMLPNILAMARKCNASERELFLVEGESAAGTAKKARNSQFQEVLRLNGKLANAIRMPMAKLMNSRPVQNVLAAMGYNHQATDIYAHLRVQRLYLLADADPDGSHINALILTVVWKLFPRLIEEGRVFICNAPLYSAYYKGRQYFGKTHEECHGKMPKGTPKDVITRAKGWGELAPETLEIIAFHPDTRNTIKVLSPRDVEEKNHFLHIMGSDSAARKELLGLN